MLNISLQHKMMMKLSPQQVQYLKMLQLPTLALEQKIKAELEMNPLLEEGMDEETDLQNQEQETAADEQAEQKTEDDYTIDDYMNDDLAGYKAKESFDSEEREELPIADAVPLHHGLSQQFTLLVQKGGILLAQPLEQPGRAFDIREQESDGSRGDRGALTGDG